MALKFDQSNQKGLRNLGFVLNRVGRSEDAEATLTRGIELGFDVPAHEVSFLHERALARAELKRYDEALADVNRAIDINPRSVKSRFLRARVYLYKEDRDNARRDALEVLRAVPDHVGALRLLDQLS
jgi:tetratricopeptide (TPR) repeat protein